jgi:hypothetical protein
VVVADIVVVLDVLGTSVEGVVEPERALVQPAKARATSMIAAKLKLRLCAIGYHLLTARCYAQFVTVGVPIGSKATRSSGSFVVAPARRCRPKIPTGSDAART